MDDSIAANFLHEKIISHTGKVNHIEVTHNGMEALDYLKGSGKFTNSKKPKPNIIFLDINMPIMNGFKFLEHYNELDESLKADVVIAFLTSSNWGKDKIKAMDSKLVFDFIQKPLNNDRFLDIYSHYIENFTNN